MKLKLKCPNCDREELNYETETRTQCGREVLSCMYLWCENGDFGTDYHASPKRMMEELYSAYEFRKKER